MPTDGETEKTERYPLVVSTGGGLTIAIYLLVPEGIEFESNSGFVPPKNLTEFLAKYPEKFREMTALAAKRFGLSPADDSLDDMTDEIVKTFLMFKEEKLEDIIEMYITAPPRLPGQLLADHFFSYLQMRTDALFPVMGFDNERRMAKMQYGLTVLLASHTLVAAGIRRCRRQRTMKLPWMCPACGTVHTHPVSGCRHCNREIPEEETDPIFRVGEPKDTEHPHHRSDHETAPKPPANLHNGAVEWIEEL